MQIDTRRHSEVPDDARPTRRTFLGKAAAGGAAVAVGSLVAPVGQLLPSASAATVDVDLETFAAGLELTAVEVYRAAIATELLTSRGSEIARSFLQHHQDHADKLNESLVEEPVTEPNATLLGELRPQIEAAADETALLEVAYSLEEALASTYLQAIGELEDARNAGTFATILPVASQHATVIASVLEKDPATYLIDFVTTDTALDPADYPAS